MLPGLTPLVVWTDRGLYCPSGDFYIDPLRPVHRAVITHAHSDHARRGCESYICAESGVGLLKVRLGKRISVRGVPYRESFSLGDVQVSLHPAGHILGSSQVRIQRGDEVWGISGDFKRDSDPSCEPFEVVKCDTWVTEATFGTPKYVWPMGQDYGEQIASWWFGNQRKGKNSLLFGYSLGKLQRILSELAPHAKRPILIHRAASELTQCYRDEGRVLAPTWDLEALDPRELLQGELILAPPSILSSEWTEKLGNFETAFASGWMLGSERGWNASGERRFDQGFVISDHADWPTLNRTVDETGARSVFVLHRGLGAFVRHLRKRGIDAHPILALACENVEVPQESEQGVLPLFDQLGQRGDG